ncbi:3-oxoadipate enol-lactonase [Amycolatopsis sp.]|uniref:3-oxoadipate enol-lactonase n=1 Tax=Amycolatopsis sp. TaxID=37632 RepID=UPI002E0B6B33|nr:3-oxoadipate enol-lactonase [Amycolatopsis sp.]
MNVNYVAEGPEGGEVVVFSGSLGSDLRMWELQAEPLAENGFRVVRYDHRGHGDSPVPAAPYSIADLGGDLIELLDTLDVPRAHVVGLSLGGMTGMWAGANASKRIASLVLCCTSAKLGPPESWAERARKVRADGTGSIAEAIVSRWVTPAYHRMHPERVDYLRQMVTDTSDEGYAACCGAIERMDLTGDLPKISAPTLVISGTEDRATPPDHGQRIADAIPGARLEIVEGAAHLGNVEQSSRFTQLILEHLKAA